MQPDSPRTFQPADAPPSSLRTLRQAIAARYGQQFLAGKRRETWGRLQALKPDPRSSAGYDIREDRFAPAGLSFAQRYVDLLTNLAALDVVERGLNGRPEAMHQPALAEFKLAPNAVATLVGFREALSADLLRLLRSEREDWGFPLLVGMARLHALELSITTGHLAILDRFEPGEIVSPSDEAGSGYRSALFEHARQAFTAAKADLSSTERLDERRYGQLEETANLFLEIRNGMKETRSARLFPAGATPSRPAVAGLIMPTMTAGQFAEYREALVSGRETYAAKLMNLYRYELLGRNCVTELFRVINQAVANPLEGEGRNLEKPEAEARMAHIRAESERLLGGYVDERSLNLIPFVSFQTVGRTYRVRSSYDWPAYREEMMQREYQRAAPFLVDLQESNVLSSAIYRWHGDDAAFLFFTQDAVWARPLLGSFNLAVALGQTLTGVLALPWDSGENLKKSMKGVFVSLPELFFFNIRKGSFPHIPWIGPTGQGMAE